MHDSTSETSTSAESRPRVVVGVDASTESQDALRWALHYAEFIGARVEVIHAWHVAEEYAWLQPLPPPAAPTEVARKALAEVVNEVAGARRSVPIETTVREGHAVHVLTEAAQGAVVLVLGSRGSGGFDGLALGSVSGHCAMHAPCSVMIVRPTASPEPS